MPKLQPRPFVSDFFTDVGKYFYYGIGSIVGLAARETISVTGTVAKKIAVPSAEESPAETLFKYYQDAIKEFPEESRNDPLLNIVLLLSSLISFVSLPMRISSTLGEKVIDQKLRANIRPSLLGTSEAITAWFREVLKEDELDAVLKKLGFEDVAIKALKKIHLAIPSAGDIVSFAVREAYDPSYITEYELDKGLSDILETAKDDLKHAGLPKDTFAKYWYAHWRLPSVMQGFEMLHREKINDEQLDDLMHALDIMPFWRSKLRDIAYLPFTRVDVRRMHKLGVLDEAAVKRSYMDLGYDDEKATKMTEFTIAYNAEPEKSEETQMDIETQQNRDLTKTDVLKGYRLGLLKDKEAVEILSLLGYSEEEIKFYLSREDYLQEEDRKDKYLKYYHDAFLKGIWTKTTLIEKIGTLNLPADYQEFLLEIWELEKEVKVTTPTKSELLGFFKKGTITETECREELQKMGYIEKYINWYLAGVEKEEIKV